MGSFGPAFGPTGSHRRRRSSATSSCSPFTSSATTSRGTSLPDKSQFEIFGPAEPNHDHFVTGPVPSFHVDDVYGAVDELRQHGVQTFGPWGNPDAGWAHFRAADGNIYGLSAGAEYRR